MEGHERSRGRKEPRSQNDKVPKASATKPVASKTDEPFSKMPLRKKVNRKAPAKNKASNNETKKKPQEGSKDRLKETVTDESSSEDKYLEDYSTGDSEYDISDSDGLSQEFSDEDKLMDYYERKLREHCLVGNVGSCSTDSDAEGGSPGEVEKPSNNQSLKINVAKQPGPTNDLKIGSQPKEAAKTVVKRPKPVHGKNQNSTLPPKVPSNTRKKHSTPGCSRTRTGKLGDYQFNNDDSSCDNTDTVDIGPKSAKDSGEPSSSHHSPMGFGLPERSSPSVKADHYDANKKVMDYLNRMEESGPSGTRGVRGKEASYQTIVEEIHNSARDHILKNYVSTFSREETSGTRRKNVRKHNYSTNSSTASESGRSGKELTKDEMVDRLLTSSMSRNSERNLTSLMDLWKSTLGQ